MATHPVEGVGCLPTTVHRLEPALRRRRESGSSNGGKGAGMSNPPDIQRNLDHCMRNIKDASEVMADDMHEAAMRLGTAEKKLATARHAVHNRAGQLTQAPAQPDTGET